jgi:C1A family cysteine protease
MHCYLAIAVTESFKNYRAEFETESFTPKPDEPIMCDRHAVLVVGYRVREDDSTELLVRNSWGASWGFEGYSWIHLTNPTDMEFNDAIYTIHFPNNK